MEDDGVCKLCCCIASERTKSFYEGLSPRTLCDSLKVCRQLSISRGIYPAHVMPEGNGDEVETVLELDAADGCELVANRFGLLEPGDMAVVVMGESISVEVYNGPMDDWTVTEDE